MSFICECLKFDLPIFAFSSWVRKLCNWPVNTKVLEFLNVFFLWALSTSWIEISVVFWQLRTSRRDAIRWFIVQLTWSVLSWRSWHLTLYLMATASWPSAKAFELVFSSVAALTVVFRIAEISHWLIHMVMVPILWSLVLSSSHTWFLVVVVATST